MQLKFFAIPFLPQEDEEEKVNKFLRSVKVLEIKRELICVGDIPYWAVCVVFLPYSILEPTLGNQKEKTDYKTVLTEKEFKLFCNLRKIRKRLADNDAVPAFAVFTDYELSEISKLEGISVSSLKSIKGIGLKKIEKYGIQLCEMINELTQNETTGMLD